MKRPIREGIEGVLRDVLDDEGLVFSEAMGPENTPEWDSFAQVKIILAIEAEYGVDFTMDEVAEMRDAGDLARVLEAKTQTRPA